MKTLLILDWDHTLFNTTAYAKGQQKALKELGITEKMFKARMEIYKNYCFTLDVDHFLEEIPDLDVTKAHEIVSEDLKEHGKQYLFDDVIVFLDGLPDTVDVHILTQGEDELQEKKIDAAGLSNIEHTVTRTGKEAVIQDWAADYDRVIVVDDTPEVITAIKKLLPDVKAYLMVRQGDAPYEGEDAMCEAADGVIHSLQEVQL